MKSFFADSGEKKIFFIPLGIFIVILIAEITGILILNSGLIVYTTDDAYIHLALAENILKGHYGVNLQENSSPSSSVLWPFILSPFTGFSLGYLIPLLINVLSSVGSIFIFFFILKKIFFKESTDNSILIKAAILLMILLIIATNLVGSLFSGMEHSLQIYLTLLNIWGLILIVTDKNIPKWFLAFIIIAPLIRFENLALSFSSLIFLYLKGYKKKAMFSFLIIVLSVSCFSIFLLSLGLKPLPLSVLQKSSVISSGGFYATLENVKDNLFSPRGSLLMIGVFVLSYFSFFTERNRAERLLAGCFSLAVLLHLVIGKEGRYIVYIWAASLFIFIFLYREWIFKTITKIGFLKTALFSSALTVLVSYYYILSILTIPISSNNIYEQHYQMHRFAADYYKKPVAVNDLGYVSFNNNNYVLDLVGLASQEALNYSQTRKTSEWIDTLCRKHDVELAMIYDDWFDTIPGNWFKAAELYLGKIKMASSRDMVSFYLLDIEKKGEVIYLLRKFRETLPEGVKLVLNE
jgi:hypothetical protein